MAASDERVARAIAALAAEKSALRARGIDALVAFALEQELGALVDVDSFVDVALSTLSVANVERALAEHIDPGWERLRAQVQASGDTLGAALQEDEREALHDTIGRLRVPPATWLEGAVDPDLIRELLAPIVQELLLAFAKKLPLAKLGEGVLGGFAGRLKKSVDRSSDAFAGLRKSVMGGLDERLAANAAEFSRSAVATLKKALVRRLKSEEGKALLADIRRQLVERALDTEIHQLMDDADFAGRCELEALAPRLIAFNVGRASIRDIVAAELAAGLAVEGGKTLATLLDEAGVRAPVEAIVRERLDGLAIEFVGTEAFAEVLIDLFEAAG